MKYRIDFCNKFKQYLSFFLLGKKGDGARVVCDITRILFRMDKYKEAEEILVNLTVSQTPEYKITECGFLWLVK